MRDASQYHFLRRVWFPGVCFWEQAFPSPEEFPLAGKLSQLLWKDALLLLSVGLWGEGVVRTKFF